MIYKVDLFWMAAKGKFSVSFFPMNRGRLLHLYDAPDNNLSKYIIQNSPWFSHSSKIMKTVEYFSLKGITRGPKAL